MTQIVLKRVYEEFSPTDGYRVLVDLLYASHDEVHNQAEIIKAVADKML